ncbi:MAG: hypothetical protein ACREBG_01815 [Pyrinomonadaceae bacterium]
MKKRRKPKLSKRVAAELFRKRSIAAKKGWVTRRHNKFLGHVSTVALRHEAVRPEVVGLSQAVAQEMARRLPEIAEVLTVERFEQTLSQIIEERVRKGELEDSVEAKIIARLLVAEAGGFFEQEVGAIADEYDITIKDVYDIWFDTP